MDTSAGRVAGRHRSPVRPAFRPDRLSAAGLAAYVALLGGAVFGAHHSSLAVVASTLVVLTVPGAGVWLGVGRQRLPNPFVSVLLISLGWSVAVGMLCAYATWQSAVGQFILLGLPAIAPAVAGIVRPGSPSRRPRLAKIRNRGLVAAVAVLVAVLGACLIVAVVVGRTHSIGVYGLLPVIGPWYVASVAAGFAIVVIGLLHPARPWWPSILGIILVSGEFDTVPVAFFDNYASPWTYNHLGVVDLIARGLPLSDHTDAFQAWPGFFSVGAEIQTLSGVPPLTYANTASALFAILCALGIMAAAHRLSESRTASVVAALVFSSTMWTAQHYYAPQSLALVLATLIATELITFLRAEASPTPWRGRLGAPLRWLLRDLPAPTYLSRAGKVALMSEVTLGFAALVVVHQLSPYVVVLQVAPFVVTGWARGWWRVWLIGDAALALGWLVVQHTAVAANNVMNGANTANLASTVVGETSPEQRLASLAAHAVVVLVYGVGLIAMLRFARRPGPVLMVLPFALMPALVLAASSYGGEGVNRVWLFTAPWFGLLIGMVLARLRRLRVVAIITTSVALLAAYLASGQATNYGQYHVNKITDRDVAASYWLADKTQPGSAIVTALPFPTRISGNYPARNPLHSVNDPSLSMMPRFAGTRLDDISPERLATDLVGAFGPHYYLVVGGVMYPEAEYFRQIPPATLRRLAQRLKESTAWHAVYVNGDLSVYQPSAALAAHVLAGPPPESVW